MKSSKSSSSDIIVIEIEHQVKINGFINIIVESQYFAKVECTTRGSMEMF